MNQLEIKKLANLLLGFRPLKWFNRYYKYDYPENAVLNDVFIMAPNYGTIWTGSLDLTKDYKKINRLSKLLNVSLIICKKDFWCNNIFDYEYDMLIANTEHGIFWMANTIKHPDWYLFNNGIKRYDRQNKVDDLCIFKPCIDGEFFFKYEFQKMKLPDLKKFKGSRLGRISPWQQFKNFFIKKYGPKKIDFFWNNFYITPEDIEIMQQNCLKFFTKHEPDKHPLLAEDSCIWDYSRNGCPFFYGKISEDLKPGYGYIKKTIYIPENL